MTPDLLRNTDQLLINSALRLRLLVPVAIENSFSVGYCYYYYLGTLYCLRLKHYPTKASTVVLHYINSALLAPKTPLLHYMNSALLASNSPTVLLLPINTTLLKALKLRYYHSFALYVASPLTKPVRKSANINNILRAC